MVAAFTPSRRWLGISSRRTVRTMISAARGGGPAAPAWGAGLDGGPDRAAGIGSVATVLGAARTVRLSLTLWAAAGLLLLLEPFPGLLAAPLVIPYLALAWPFRSVRDADSGTANRGWRRFLLVNYLVGFAVTMILIAIGLSR